MTLTHTEATIDKENLIETNLYFILEHLSGPLFPRTIMTKALGYQKEVFNKHELLTYFKASNYHDCRINAYPAYTEYKGINLIAPSFIMIDLDLKDFELSIDKILNKTLTKINDVFYGSHPTVLWTGNGYHIYQPVHGFILEEIDRFESLSDPFKKDLTSRFMQFAESFFTDKKCDPQHRPSIKSCLIRIPGTTNSKCNQAVKIVQRWDGIKPPINYLLRDYRTWLVAEKINKKMEKKSSRNYRKSYSLCYNGTDTIQWIEKLLQIPIADHRKYAIWRILIPYLFNIRNLSDTNVTNIIQDWLNKCDETRALDFNVEYSIRQNIRNGKRYRYLPIGINKLSSENYELYKIIRDDITNGA
ncbi:MAG: DNA primase noncatalytic subunit PriX [Nitrososphaeraceae archaeon]